MFWNPMYFVFALPALLLALYAQWKVSSTYKRMSKEPNMIRMTGADAARRLLDSNGLRTINLEGTPGELSDHYDPSAKVLRLSQGVASSASVAALGIVAHEVSSEWSTGLSTAGVQLILTAHSIGVVTARIRPPQSGASAIGADVVQTIQKEVGR